MFQTMRNGIIQILAGTNKNNPNMIKVPGTSLHTHLKNFSNPTVQNKE